MTGFPALLALCAGTFFLGIAFTVKLLFSVAAHNSGDDGEGCFGNAVAGVAVLLAGYCFYLAFTSA
jgi:hypothetical protein